MAEESAKLRIPYIAAAQAQKHVTHNEAMTLLDTLVQLSVIDKDLATPPGAPAEGDTYIVAASGTGAWIGWDGRVARFIDGTWRSYLPGEGDGAGWLAYVIDESTLYVFTGTGWEQLFVAEGHSGVSSVNGEAGDVVLTLDDLDDVEAASPGDGHVLTWDDGAGEWIPAAPTGGDPVTLEPQGEWGSGISYAKLDVVSYAGASYVSRIDGNIGNQPDTSADEWMLLAAQGEPGASAVDSVNGVAPLMGNVSLAAADIPVTPAGGLTADDVQAALEELDGDIGNVASDVEDRLPLAGGTMTGNIAFSGTQTVDGRDVSDDGAKLDGIAAGADVTGAGNVGVAIHGASGKTTPIDADTLPLIDSAASNALKKVTWANLKATLKTYLDTLYQPVAAGVPGTIGITIDGGGSTITPGVKGYIEVPSACTITQWTLLGDTAGAIKIDVWKDSYANFPPDNSDSIANGHEPEIAASGVKAQDADLSDWTSVAVSAGDIIGFNVDSCAAITRAHLILKVLK